jgi:hypothetical protein
LVRSSYRSISSSSASSGLVVIPGLAHAGRPFLTAATYRGSCSTRTSNGFWKLGSNCSE